MVYISSVQFFFFVCRKREENEKLLKDLGAFNVLERVEQRICKKHIVHGKDEEKIQPDNTSKSEDPISAQKVFFSKIFYVV